MTHSAFETLASHGFACSRVRSCAARPMNTKPSLIWEKPEYLEGLDALATWADQGLWMSGHVSQGSMSRDHGTKNWSQLKKIHSLTNRAWSRSRSSKASNALWTWCMTSTILNTKLGSTRWKSRMPKWSSTYDSYVQQHWMPESERLYRH
jgi:hypothetical protein